MSNVAEILKVVFSLSSNKLAILAVLVLFLIGMTVAYEIHTSQFELEKLSKISTLISEVEPLTKSDNAEVKSLAENILKKIDSILDEESNIAQTTIDPRILLMVLMGLPWLVLSITGIVEAFQGESDWHYGTCGCLFLGFVLGFIGYSIPVDIHWFYRYVLFPLIVTGVILAVFYAVGDDEKHA